MPGGGILLALVLTYYLPWMVADAHRHRRRGAILVLNAAFGWTVIGWLAALFWASVGVRHPAKLTPVPAQASCTHCGAPSAACTCAEEQNESIAA